MSLSYKILAANEDNGTVTIQFEYQHPYNISVPCVDGQFLTGDLFEGWVQGLNPQNRWDTVSTATGWDQIAVLVSDGVPTPFPSPPIRPGYMINTGTVATEGVTTI